MPLSDATEPEPMDLVQGVENPYEEPYLWRVELYLISKYQPEAAQATIFKVRSASLERAKVVKEHHEVLTSDQLERQIVDDLEKHVQWSPPHSLKGKYGAGAQAPRPGIGKNYNQQGIS